LRLRDGVEGAVALVFFAGVLDARLFAFFRAAMVQTLQTQKKLPAAAIPSCGRRSFNCQRRSPSNGMFEEHNNLARGRRAPLTTSYHNFAEKSKGIGLTVNKRHRGV
jgi:hypothetical protein